MTSQTWKMEVDFSQTGQDRSRADGFSPLPKLQGTAALAGPSPRLAITTGRTPEGVLGQRLNLARQEDVDGTIATNLMPCYRRLDNNDGLKDDDNSGVVKTSSWSHREVNKGGHGKGGAGI